MRLATERVYTMSPLPFSTTTLIAHGAGSVAAAEAAAEAFGFALERASTTESVAARTSAPTAATAPRRRHGPSGFGGVGSPASPSASRCSRPRHDAERAVHGRARS